MQVHGGMGFIEETGAAQYVRDVRITTIYEGTTGIQANDLIGRKIGRDRGAAMGALIDEMQTRREGLEARRTARRRRWSCCAMRLASLLQAQGPPRRRVRSRWRFRFSSWPVSSRAAGSWRRPARSCRTDNRTGRSGISTPRRFRRRGSIPSSSCPVRLALARVVKSGGPSVSESDAALI